MGEIRITSKGSFEKATDYLERLKMLKYDRILKNAGQRGVDALRDATPRGDSGQLADSWTYEIIHEGSRARIEWHNTDIEGGFSVALLVQYGHGTNNGGYVPPHDYINPAIQPIIDEISRQIGEEVKHL